MACFATPYGLRYAAHCFNRADAQNNRPALIPAGGKLGVTSAELSELPVTNRFIYSAEHKAKRNLDHDGQDAVMFACRVGKKTPLRLQAEEVADAKWFSVSAASQCFPVKAQRRAFLQCLSHVA